MTRDEFHRAVRRLALVAAAAAFATAVALIVRWLGWPTVLAVIAATVALSVAATVELEPDEEEPVGPSGLTRRQIETRREAASGEVE